jgi:hypothetical protein
VLLLLLLLLVDAGTSTAKLVAIITQLTPIIQATHLQALTMQQLKACIAVIICTTPHKLLQLLLQELSLHSSSRRSSRLVLCSCSIARQLCMLHAAWLLNFLLLL